VANGEALHVELVDRPAVPGIAQLPEVDHRRQLVDDDRLGHRGRAVAIVLRQVGVGMAERVPEDQLVPAHVPVDRLGVGVDEQLGRVEAVALLRLVGAVDPIAVALAGTDPGEVDVPDQIRLLRNADPGQLVIAFGTFEKAELDTGGVLGEQGEVDALAVPRGPEGIWAAGPGLHL
jgi:hypothetical protein